MTAVFESLSQTAAIAGAFFTLIMICLQLISMDRAEKRLNIEDSEKKRKAAEELERLHVASATDFRVLQSGFDSARNEVGELVMPLDPNVLWQGNTRMSNTGDAQRAHLLVRNVGAQFRSLTIRKGTPDVSWRFNYLTDDRGYVFVDLSYLWTPELDGQLLAVAFDYHTPEGFRFTDQYVTVIGRAAFRRFDPAPPIHTDSLGLGGEKLDEQDR